MYNMQQQLAQAQQQMMQQMMQQNTQQVSNLPHPVNAFNTQPVSPNIANPVFNQHLTSDPGFVQYSAMIAWALANEIYTRAANAQVGNALRIFGFNLYAFNNYANTDFIEAARILAERVRMAIMRREYNTVEDAIRALTPDTYTILCGALVRKYQGLTNHIPQNIVQECYNAVAALDRICNEINGMANVGNSVALAGNLGTVANPVQNTGFTNFNNVATNQSIQQNNVVNTVSQISNNQNLTPMERQLLEIQASSQNNVVNNNQSQVTTNNSLSSMYVDNPVEATVPTIPENIGIAHYGANAPTQPVIDNDEFQKQVQIAKSVDLANPMLYNPGSFSVDEITLTPEEVNSFNVQRDNNDGSVFVVIDDKRIDIVSVHRYGQVEWKPSAIQPFHPFVSLSHQYVGYMKLATGEVIAIVRELNEGKYHMDYDKHAVTAEFSSEVPIVKQTRKPQEKPSFNDLSPENLIIGTVDSDALSVEEAINSTLLSAHGYFINNDQEYHGFINLSRVLTPVVFKDKKTCNEVGKAITNISNSNTFDVAAKYISKIADPEIRSKINKIVTERINFVVRFEISVPSDPITDFMEDHAELLSVINKHYAGAIAESINTQQFRIINNALNVVDAKNISDIESYFCIQKGSKGYEDLVERTMFLSRNVSVGVINAESHSLAPFFAKESTAVLETTNPQLRELIEQTIKYDKLNSSYIVTLDGVVFAVSNSIMQKSACLIHKV